MSRTVLADVEGFTPCIDVITKEYGVMVSAVFGRIWRYCQGDRQVCNAALETIADDLRMGYNTVLRHVKQLVTDGYLEDLTPDLRNRPHTYRDTGKVHVVLSITAGLPKSESDRSPKMAEQVSQNGIVHSAKMVDEDSVKIQIKKEEEEVIPTTEGITYFLKMMGAKRLNTVQRKRLHALEQTHGTNTLKEMTDWCALNNMAIGRAITSMTTAAPTWGQPKQKPAPKNGNKPAQQQVDDEWEAAFERARKRG